MNGNGAGSSTAGSGAVAVTATAASVAVTKSQYSSEETIQIYTDWANHYLEKSRSKRRISTLATDCSDGVLLADIIESVINHKVPEINRKPKNSNQMLDNIELCLQVLRKQNVPGIENIVAAEIREGRLKAVLSLFFALSRFKQSLKMQQQLHQQQQQSNFNSPLISIRHSTSNSGVANKHVTSSNIPQPGSVLLTRKSLAAHTHLDTRLSKIGTTAAAAGTPVPNSYQNRQTSSSSSNGTTSAIPVTAQSLIPRGPQQSQPQSSIKSPSCGNGTANTSMLEKLKHLRGSGTNLTKRTSSCSAVSSTNRSSENGSLNSLLEPPVQVSALLQQPKATKLKPQQPQSQRVVKTNAATKPSNGNRSAVAAAAAATAGAANRKTTAAADVEKHAQKIATITSHHQQSSKALNRLSGSGGVHAANGSRLSLLGSQCSINQIVSTGIPKPTAAIKGTTKPAKDELLKVAAETTAKVQTALISPMAVHSSATETVTNAVPATAANEPLEPQPEKSEENSQNGDDKQPQPQDLSLTTEDDSLTIMNVVPMKPLMRAYSSNLALSATPRRSPPKSHHHTNPIYSNSNLNVAANAHHHHQQQQLVHAKDNFNDLLSGYLSESEMLRPSSETGFGKLNEISDGYMSEGGGIGIGNGFGLANGSAAVNGAAAGGMISMYSRKNSHHHHHHHHHHQQQQQQQHNGLNGLRQPRLVPSLAVLNEQQQQQQQQQQQCPNGPTLNSSNSLRTGASSGDVQCANNLNGSRATEGGSPSAALTSLSSSTMSLNEPRKMLNKPSQQPSHSSSRNHHRNPMQSNFGYAKKSSLNCVNGTDSTNDMSAATSTSSGSGKSNGQIVPRSSSAQKAKVSDGTQTCTSDLQQQLNQKSNSLQYKSYSLTGNAANQLSQSIRERLISGSQSLPKSTAAAVQDYAIMMRHHHGHGHGHHHSARSKAVNGQQHDGSLSDTQLADCGTNSSAIALGLISGAANGSATSSSSYNAWIRHSNTYSIGAAAARLLETNSGFADSLENFANLIALNHRNSLTPGSTRLAREHLVQPPQFPVSRLSRSNSISSRSSKSMNSNRHSETEPDSPAYYCLPISTAAAMHNNWSQPPSPGHANSTQSAIRSFPMSPTHSTALAHGRQQQSSHSKDDEVHGSAISLISTASSIYSSVEDKHTHEIRKLRKELREAHEKVYTLTSQLKTNAHVVSAFEQSLTSMSSRLQNLTATSEKKDSELTELRTAMESLRMQSVQAGLVRQLSSDSVSSLSSGCSQDNNNSGGGGGNGGGGGSGSNAAKQDRKKKKGWLRSSFTKAFSRTSKISKIHTQVADIAENSAIAVAATLAEHQHHQLGAPGGGCGSAKQSPQHTATAAAAPTADKSTEVVAELEKQLREKDMVLTDIRLEALSSAHQLESLKDTVMKMKSEMMSLKQNNERLQRMVGVCGADGGGGGGSGCGSGGGTAIESLLTGPINIDDQNLFTLTDERPMLVNGTDLDPVTMDGRDGENNIENGIENSPETDVISLEDDVDNDGKPIAIAVYLGQPHNFNRYYFDIYESSGNCPLPGALNELQIGQTRIGNRTNWAGLDEIVRRAFKQYVHRLDPSGTLGVRADAIVCYRLGEAERTLASLPPDFLPIGYTVGSVSTLHVVLQPLDAFAFEALIPRGVAQRLLSLLDEHKRIVFCGVSGIGKSYLANRLAEFFVCSLGLDPAHAVVTFNVDNKTSDELKQYLGQLGATGQSKNTPVVLVLDNLHRLENITDTLSTLPHSVSSSCRLIGTMIQTTGCNTASSLQLDYGFRWVHVAPHMEPTRGLLARVLQRRLISHDFNRTNGTNKTPKSASQPPIIKVFQWLPRVWQHINTFLETHNSGDVAIGPRLFLTCPIDAEAAQAWFSDTWNYSIAPYLKEAAQEGVRLYASDRSRAQAPWIDPVRFIIDTYPWPSQPPQGLLGLKASDIGLEAGSPIGEACGTENATPSERTVSSPNHDPLLNMLIRLQEAANSAVETNEIVQNGSVSAAGSFSAATAATTTTPVPWTNR